MEAIMESGLYLFKVDNEPIQIGRYMGKDPQTGFIKFVDVVKMKDVATEDNIKEAIKNNWKPELHENNEEDVFYVFKNTDIAPSELIQARIIYFNSNIIQEMVPVEKYFCCCKI